MIWGDEAQRCSSLSLMSWTTGATRVGQSYPHSTPHPGGGVRAGEGGAATGKGGRYNPVLPAPRQISPEGTPVSKSGPIHRLHILPGENIQGVYQNMALPIVYGGCSENTSIWGVLFLRVPPEGLPHHPPGRDHRRVSSSHGHHLRNSTSNKRRLTGRRIPIGSAFLLLSGCRTGRGLLRIG